MFCSERLYNVRGMASVSASYAAGQERGLVEIFHTCVLANGSPFKRRSKFSCLSVLLVMQVFFPHDLTWNPGFAAAKD